MNADTVFLNATIFTSTTDRPVPGAFALRGGTLLAVGTREDVEATAGPDTDFVSLEGAFVMPGFVDAHNHVSLHGQAELHEVVVPREFTLDQVLDAVDRHVRADPSEDWVVVAAYGSQLLGELGSHRTLARLDAVSGGRPVMIRESSRHNRWVNSEAMRRAGIGDDSPDPPHGRIVRDPDTGGLTGLLVESAGIPVEHAYAATRAFTLADHRERMRAGIRPLSRLGVTAMHDAGASEASMSGAASLDADGQLDAWVVSAIPVHEQIFGFLPRGEDVLARAGALRSEHHRPSFIKIFMDGIPPTRTASFLDPYQPSPDFPHGVHVGPLLGEEELVCILEDAARLGLSAKFHCTGDGAVHAALNAVERVRADGFEKTIYQIGHSQFISEGDVARFTAVGAVVEISPYMWYPGAIPSMIDDLVRPGLARRMHPNRELLDAGATVSVGSDWPAAANPNPWHAVHGLVNRTDPTGTRPGVSALDQAVTVAEALTMTTLHGARALGISDRTGSLEPGKSADFIVTDANPFDIAPEELRRIGVTQTWFAGRRVA
ncbi:amidohydrolase [Microbacterium sp.]|uniref:amidohydrolase n=1 Tax=Microbacterium sp. TaxID=51671 RepID=UPI0039E407D7